MTQEEILELQKETYETVKEYLAKLIPSMSDIVSELKGELQEDTWEYFNMMIEGFNWVVQAFNGIVDYIDKDKTIFDIPEIDNSVSKLGEAYRVKDAMKVAESLENDIIPFLKKIDQA